MKELKVGQPVWCIEINYPMKEDSFKRKEIIVKEYSVLGISEYNICLNNDWFDRFDRVRQGGRKESYCNYLDDVNVSIRTGDHILKDGVFVSLSTTSKPTKRTFNKMMRKYREKVLKEYSFLFDGLDVKIEGMIDSFLSK